MSYGRIYPYIDMRLIYSRFGFYDIRPCKASRLQKRGGIYIEGMVIEGQDNPPLGNRLTKSMVLIKIMS